MPRKRRVWGLVLGGQLKYTHLILHETARLRPRPRSEHVFLGIWIGVKPPSGAEGRFT